MICIQPKCKHQASIAVAFLNKATNTVISIHFCKNHSTEAEKAHLYFQQQEREITQQNLDTDSYSHISG